jgi:hypothetical protein
VFRHLSDSFPDQNGLKQGDGLSSLRFSFGLECAFRKAKEISRIFLLNGAYQLLVYADSVNRGLLDENITAIKKNPDAPLHARKGVAVELNADKTKYRLMSRHQNSEKYRI